MGFNMRKINLVLAMVATSITLTFCSDPSPLQDFCVADSMSNVLVNGFVCKDPKMVTDKDFFLSGLLAKQRTIETNAIGSTVTAANVANIPGLNTLGISLARIDFELNGLNPPHVHPRATEILTLLQGKLEVGFVTSNPDNRLIARVLEAGDVFVFPVGLVHFQINRGRERAVAIAALSSQNPGVVNIANALFASDPPIDGDVLSKAFQLEQKVVDYLLDRSWTNNN